MDRPVESSAAQLIPDVVMRMRNHLGDVDVQIAGHSLIQQFSSAQLRQDQLGPLRQNLVEVVLSGLSLHCRNNLIVEKFSYLLLDKIKVDSNEIDWYQGSIDCLLQIIGDENLCATAIRSTLRLLREIAIQSDVNQRNLFGEQSMEIFQLIERQLVKPYDWVVAVSWDCFYYICYESEANQRSFLNIGGINLFQLCYREFHSQPYFVSIMIGLMKILSSEESFRHNLIDDGNLTILWEIWGETQDGQIGKFCFDIFSNFLSSSPPLNWPSGHSTIPTIEDVKRKLEEEKEENDC